MIRRIKAFVIAALMMCIATSVYAFEVKNGVSYIVIDAKTGDILDEKNGYDYKYPASLTKIMTLYVLFEEIEQGNLTLNSQLKVSNFAASKPASKLFLQPGASIRVEDAIKALVIKSANDVAVVVAEAISGTEEAFAQRMTGTARRLGMVRTQFRNASGLHDPQQISSPFDMYKLGLALQDRFPQYYKYFGMTEFSFAGNKIEGHNALVKVRGIDGIKTGYTRASGFNVVSNVKMESKHIISVVMGSPTSKERNELSIKIIKDSLRYASADGRITPREQEEFKPVNLFGNTSNGSLVPPQNPFRFKEESSLIDPVEMKKSPANLFMFSTYQSRNMNALVFD